jgi:hypothetical protein
MHHPLRHAPPDVGLQIPGVRFGVQGTGGGIQEEEKMTCPGGWALAKDATLGGKENCCPAAMVRGLPIPLILQASIWLVLARASLCWVSKEQGDKT